MSDLDFKLVHALVTIYNWGPTDRTFLWKRHVRQDVQDLTSAPGLYDGDDIQEEVRNYLRDLAD